VLEWIGKRYMRMQAIRHEEQGFTLIELLIVTETSVENRRL
jgi:Prokaryotic N-terminal methylation motif